MSVAQIQALTALIVATGSAATAILAAYHAITAKRQVRAVSQQASPAGAPSSGQSPQ